MGKDNPKIEQMRAARLRQERDYLESLSEPSLTKIKRLASLSGESYEEVVERKATQRKTAELEADGYSPSEAVASAELWAVKAAEDKTALPSGLDCQREPSCNRIPTHFSPFLGHLRVDRREVEFD